jgi:NAD(P)-dependent dehydrogenase (short-subunit alcohol dehydrogenase family)
MSVRELSGSTAIVTGASRGFGRATAIALASRGAHVVGVARSSGPLKELEEQLGGLFTAEAGDVADASLAGQLFARYSPQTVVLNAGTTPVMGPLPEQTWQNFSRTWEVDVHQVFNFLREALTVPMAPGGVVVSFSSGAALRGSPLSGGYAGAKATIKLLSSYAGSESAGASLGLRFVSLLPQLTNSTALGRTGVGAYAERAGLTVETYLERSGFTLTEDQVADSVVRLATDDEYSADAYLLTAKGLDAIT